LILIPGALRAWNLVISGLAPFGLVDCVFDLTKRSKTAARTVTTAFPSAACSGVLSILESYGSIGYIIKKTLFENKQIVSLSR